MSICNKKVLEGKVWVAKDILSTTKLQRPPYILGLKLLSKLLLLMKEKTRQKKIRLGEMRNFRFSIKIFCFVYLNFQTYTVLPEIDIRKICVHGRT